METSTNKTKHTFKRPFTFARNNVYRPLRQIQNMERNKNSSSQQATYFTLNAPPSLIPPKKYSDISGLPALYVDPHTKLRYANVEEYNSMQHMPSDIIMGYLAARGYTSAVG
ncbi:INO80 complex subunit C [Drosophila busckii]|uniref:INO80 complex subunit C n=1 Tax=Drosophila busckii TaxID=30019 RepID=UPI00083EB11A|nr:INO80 complex subunit C [Drosophila busckii]